MLEQQIELLMTVLRKLFKDNLQSLYSLSPNPQTLGAQGSVGGGGGQQTLSKYKESLDILNISPECLDQFLNPAKAESTNEYRQLYEEEVSKFEKELAQGEQINAHKIYKMLSESIEDRVHRAKTPPTHT